MANKERLRNLIDLPEKAAIGTGTVLIGLSVFAPVLFPVGAELLIGGGVGLGMSRAALPKKSQ